MYHILLRLNCDYFQTPWRRSQDMIILLTSVGAEPAFGGRLGEREFFNAISLVAMKEK
jgi:hypothetical protein